MRANKPQSGPAAGAGTDAWLTAGLAVVIAVIAFAVYLPTLRSGFVDLDDPKYVLQNPFIRSLGVDLLKNAFTRFYASNWHPLTFISLAIDYSLWGLAPRGYHAENIVLHALNTGLVFMVMARLAGHASLRRLSALSFAAVAALLFGLHPTRVESVSWITERKDVLYALFYLLSVLAYLRYARLRSAPFYCLSIVLFILSILSKPMAITLPAALLIIDLYPLRRLGEARRVVMEKLPFFLISALSAAFTVLAQKLGGALRPLDAFPLSERVFIAARAPFFYISKLIIPAGLSPYYPVPSGSGLFTPAGALYAGGFIAVSALCLYSARKRPLYPALWLYYVLSLSPVIGIVQVGTQAAADRYTYMPGLAVFMLAGAGAAVLFEKGGRGVKALTAAIALAVAIVLAGLTIRQQAVWSTPLAVWDAVIKNYPELPLAYNSRGLTHQDRAEYVEALEDFKRAISLDPRYPYPYSNLGFTYYKLRDIPKAVENYDRALQIKPDLKNAYNNRGLAFQESGDLERALTDYSKAVSLDPSFVNPYINRGLALMEAKRYIEAVKDFDVASGLSPEDPAIYENRGYAYMNLNSLEKAAQDLKKAVELDPDLKPAYYALGLIYRQLNDREKEAYYLGKASMPGVRPPGRP